MSGTQRPLVVVVAYGDPGHLRACLEGLAAPSGTVVVVDNELSPVVEELCAAHDAAYVRPPSNVGFAAGVNLGCRDRGNRDVLLLNPDALLAWPQVLELQQHLRAESGRAAVTPLMLRPDGSGEPASWPVPTPVGVWADALGLARLHRGPRFLTGAVLLLSGPALDQVGGFDECYFLYAEECDWQLRAQRAGWSVSVVDKVTAMHLGGATSSSATLRSEHFHRSARLFARKWYGTSGALVMWAASFAAALRRTLTGGRSGRAEALDTVRTYLRRAA